MNTEILKLLEKDAKLNARQIAAFLGMDEQAAASAISDLEKNKFILGYQALVNWDKTDTEMVTALIEVKITPQRGNGFDHIAERIYQFDEVESVYLMSGGYDLAVIISHKTMRDVANFVFARLAIIDGVVSTATHFILRKYKEKHLLFIDTSEQEERVLFV